MDADTAIKLAILAALSPFWWPLLRTLYEECDRALLREGGLFGRQPTERDLARREARDGVYKSGMLSEPLARFRGGGGGRGGRGARPGGGRGPVQRPRRAGF